MMNIKSDYETTGKLYPKLHAYDANNDDVWLTTTCQFKTMKKFKSYLADVFPGVDIKIEKAS